MNIEAVKLAAKQAEKSMPWLGSIRSHEEYKELIAMMDELVEDYEANKFLINLLFPVIENYENVAPEFEDINSKLDSLDQGVAMLRVIMDQHGLKGTDFANEIGSKSTVSMILNGTRQLTLAHIKALSNRFSIPVHMFIEDTQ